MDYRVGTELNTLGLKDFIRFLYICPVKVFSAAAESSELSQGAELHLLQSFTSSSKNVSPCSPVLRLTVFFRRLICEITDKMYAQIFEIMQF